MTEATIPPCRGLIAGWRLAGSGPERLDEPMAARALAEGEAGLWLHLDLVDVRARAFLAALPALPEPARAALAEADAHVRLEEAGEAVFGALPDFHYEREDGAALATGLLRFALTPRLLVTARRHPLRAVHEALQRPAAATAPEALAALLEAVVAELLRVTAGLGDRLGRVEDAMLRPGAAGMRTELAALRRDALRLSRHFAPLAEVAATLREEPPDWADAAPLRRAARHAQAALRGVEGLAERARLAQDTLDSAATEETNRRLLVLSVISAAMLPASLVAGIFGMNVGGVPGVPGEEGGAGWGFWMAMGLVGASIGGTLAALRLARML